MIYMCHKWQSDATTTKRQCSCRVDLSTFCVLEQVQVQAMGHHWCRSKNAQCVFAIDFWEHIIAGLKLVQ